MSFLALLQHRIGHGIGMSGSIIEITPFIIAPLCDCNQRSDGTGREVIAQRHAMRAFDENLVLGFNDYFVVIKHEWTLRFKSNYLVSVYRAAGFFGFQVLR